MENEAEDTREDADHESQLSSKKYEGSDSKPSKKRVILPEADNDTQKEESLTLPNDRTVNGELYETMLKFPRGVVTLRFLEDNFTNAEMRGLLLSCNIAAAGPHAKKTENGVRILNNLPMLHKFIQDTLRALETGDCHLARGTRLTDIRPTTIKRRRRSRAELEAVAQASVRNNIYALPDTPSAANHATHTPAITPLSRQFYRRPTRPGERLGRRAIMPLASQFHTATWTGTHTNPMFAALIVEPKYPPHTHTHTLAQTHSQIKKMHNSGHDVGSNSKSVGHPSTSNNHDQFGISCVKKRNGVKNAVLNFGEESYSLTVSF
eukprot:TRINITY_DN5902_c0_g1::TRINITY_DN5902_c0_g1_i1::g.24419::m.24419 TRINITY_DN5902_c0_g1::TRINITY_DN5902_c0_g1_i1::g.24419  ORF type:complete len:321 (+),score=35.59 TRINITY_DN5902_c0_g1_i1:84-1046(+)